MHSVSSDIPPSAHPSRRLSRATLGALPSNVARPAYDPAGVAPGIVHLGVGAFMRAHLSVYTDDILAAGARDWGIVGSDLMSAAPRHALAPQDGLYTLVVRDAVADRLRVVGSLHEVLAVPEDPAATLDRMTDPRTRIVTLTVTEKGYCQDAATGALDEAHPAIVADLQAGALPRSVPGLLTEAIARRRNCGLAPFTVLVCDNLSQNGTKAHGIVTRFAELRDPSLARYIADAVRFPNTMVDRITPATRDEDRQAVAAALGLEDAWPVVCEPFRQWVIEDRFTAGRPRWEDVGATLVDDVMPFEIMKLRCLNGTHSAMAYLGVLIGLDTVAGAFGDPAIAQFIARLWTEDLVPTVPPVPGTDIVRYTEQLAERYRNPNIRHRTLQIASDGSQKLPPRLLEPALERLHAGGSARRIAFVVAAWMRFVLCVDDQGAAYEISDPLATRLARIGRECGRNATQLAEALFAVSDIFTPALLAQAAFRAQVVKDLDHILTEGTRQALAACLAEGPPAKS
ncbi:MAG: mannitol dehydrogenase family protein [Acetobacteraceae bacterium]|nr:mannitol dehydrogenase family protein [Acetobacteraceae bacterium]